MLTHCLGVSKGVFASGFVRRGSLVETAHCIVVPAEEYKHYVRHTVFESYLFKGAGGEMLLALGHGSLFNHSQQPNLDYRVNSTEKVITFTATRDIHPGEELTFFYGHNLWFQEADSCTDTVKQQQQLTPLHDHMDNEDAFLGAINL